MRKFVFFILLFLSAVSYADNIDDLQQRLQANSQVQEKVYLHTDNNCYFVGDTLWYKAYVLRADNLTPTDMSRILYVELLSPDGVLVERQRIVVSDQVASCGQFVLKDSLYSGYYEMRAYTRWMLNFNVTERKHSVDDRRIFYNNKMASDYFRDWDGLYSRVLPVFSKPEKNGDYNGKYMYSRPKQEMPYANKEKLVANFYPEGGNMVVGIKNHIAFELFDQDGQAVSINGKLSDGTPLTAGYMGRGEFDVVPQGQKALFEWKGKEYRFDLPDASQTGAAVHFDAITGKLNIRTVGCQQGAYAILCRGKLISFHRSADSDVVISSDSLPTGVNEVRVFDTNARILATRLFFVNHHDGRANTEVSTDKTDYNPYEPILIKGKVETGQPSTSMSISLRDTRTDDTSYDDGSMLEDLLLSSDLKGFIASPSYYFKSDDEKHRMELDMLMKVQGWRKYKMVNDIRYQPEKTLTISGSVNKMLSVDMLELDNIASLKSKKSVAAQSIENAENAVSSEGITMEGLSESDESENESTEADIDIETESHLGTNNKGGLKHEVIVEAEIAKGKDVAGAAQRTRNGGLFEFQIPPFYGKAVLFMKAYEVKDSVKKAMESRKDKHSFNEDKYPDFYVKQDLFYPVFTKPYNWYQTHLPDLLLSQLQQQDSVYDSRLDGDHTLSTVKVKARRRTRRGVDFSRPAYVVDAYDLYNEATDRGISWGVPNMGTFARMSCYTVYGNMNRRNTYNVRGMIDHKVFYLNYSPQTDYVETKTDVQLLNELQLKRIRNFRFYTDYEPRNADMRLSESQNQEDITVDYELFEGGGVRSVSRDRKYEFDGFVYPEKFYSPDYSGFKPQEPTDYRRTLYWNPNVKVGEDGQIDIKCYNNSRETRVKVSVAGVTKNGKIICQ